MPFGVLGLVLAVRIVREYLGAGWAGLNYGGNIWLVVGWGIGHWLADIDHLFYALVCNPQELSCMRVRNELANRRWRSAWQMLKSTAPERTRMPVRNVLTGLIVSVMAIWVVTSSGSMIASGVAVGLGVRLLLEFWQASDYRKWYWLFAREFSSKENTLVKWVWSLLLIVAVLGLAR